MWNRTVLVLVVAACCGPGAVVVWVRVSESALALLCLGFDTRCVLDGMLSGYGTVCVQCDVTVGLLPYSHRCVQCAPMMACRA